MLNDSVADLLTRIRNAQRAGQASVRIRPFKLGQKILGVLAKEGFISAFENVTDAEGRPQYEVKLKYYAHREPAITQISRISKPGRRVYMGYESLAKVSQGLGSLVLSTSHGVMSDRDARKKKVGGEILAKVA